MFNIFKKKNKTGNPMDPQNMGFLQKMAMKRLEKMSPEERNKLMKKVMTPDNIKKNKEDILKTLEQMKKTGQMNDHQIFEAKKRLGLL
jgi:hypothetical protein